MLFRSLNWSKKFSTFCFLDNHGYHIKPQSVESLLAVGVKRKISCNAGNALEQLQQFIDNGSDRDGQTHWLFGHLGFDLKNEIEGLSSAHPDRIGFPDLYFFEPEIIIRLNENELIIEGDDPNNVYREITAINTSIVTGQAADISIQQQISKEEYITIIKRLQQHIHRGDCYEINFCQEFFAEKVKIDPVSVYKKLSQVSPNPFSALYKIDDKWLLCASPERFLKKTGSNIISQPIKGTLKRTGKKDDECRMELYQSTKDRSENVMVVDLVRNDLAKICKEGSIEVDELFGIYTFPQVHHMISTISGELKEGLKFSDIIRAAFPMGSMTGAPKRSVLQFIEQYERTKRGIFSGALGYISPADDQSVLPADFDFNVVIRSIMYNATSSVLSFQTGSGITFYSDAEKEWEECLLKAAAIKQVLGQE